MTDIRTELAALADPAYKTFQEKLTPTVDPARILGVRTPALRAYAKSFQTDARKEAFLASLPHGTYEENNLHAFVIEGIREFDACLAALDRFLPYVDNWATCDCMSPKALGKDKARLREAVDRWLASGETYTVRYGIGALMRWFLDDDFTPDVAEAVIAVESGEYYVNMMRAWFFATALAKRYEETLPCFTERRLDAFTHKKAIQKAIESYRITPEQKAFLRTLR